MLLFCILKGLKQLIFEGLCVEIGLKLRTARKISLLCGSSHTVLDTTRRSSTLIHLDDLPARILLCVAASTGRSLVTGAHIVALVHSKSAHPSFILEAGLAWAALRRWRREPLINVHSAGRCLFLGLLLGQKSLHSLGKCFDRFDTALCGWGATKLALLGPLTLIVV